METKTEGQTKGTREMRGHIQRRGNTSWRLKFDLGNDPVTGKRRTRYASVRGAKKDAERELRSLIYSQDKGVSIDPLKITLAQFLDEWLDKQAPQRVAPKSLERYRGLVRNQIKRGRRTQCRRHYQTSSP